MVYSTLKFELDGHVAVLTINRPDKLNSLSGDTMEELRQAFDEVEDNRQIRCLIITGAGDRAFSTGFDLEGTEMPEGTDAVLRMVESNFKTFKKIWDLRIPVISAVNGYAIAAGSNLAMIADITIASEERGKFGEPELRHFALSPMMLLPWFASNRKMVHYLYYSGDTITATEALEIGMVAKVVPHEELMNEALRMARRIAMVPAYSVEMTKESLRRGYEAMGFISAMQHHRALDTLVLGASGMPEKEEFFDLMASGDMRAFLDKRDGPFK